MLKSFSTRSGETQLRGKSVCFHLPDYQTILIKHHNNLTVPETKMEKEKMLPDVSSKEENALFPKTSHLILCVNYGFILSYQSITTKM